MSKMKKIIKCEISIIKLKKMFIIMITIIISNNN